MWDMERAVDSERGLYYEPRENDWNRNKRFWTRFDRVLPGLQRHSEDQLVKPAASTSTGTASGDRRRQAGRTRGRAGREDRYPLNAAHRAPRSGNEFCTSPRRLTPTA